jgi:hypothetical protein
MTRQYEPAGKQINDERRIVNIQQPSTFKQNGR